MARVSSNDPKLYDIYVIADRVFGACQIDSHDGCMDGYTYTLSNRMLSVCQCKCHESAVLTGRES